MMNESSIKNEFEHDVRGKQCLEMPSLHRHLLIANSHNYNLALSAISELVDNSYDAKADKVLVSVDRLTIPAGKLHHPTSPPSHLASLECTTGPHEYSPSPFSRSSCFLRFCVPLFRESGFDLDSSLILYLANSIINKTLTP
ncbi:hypothetical protein L3Y34_002482 [Caenorhabditis briggsae]|uniref:Uncharacterized protein n=1 Tax=Caenorhabditis briggsae TaxID=6238 RepID=A0AAE9DF23_CAEBR|nr:hypothetical protein L3Y34_002482 [Caenorhabditis briggsae]